MIKRSRLYGEDTMANAFRNLMKGGSKKLETKSRYEVIGELEEKKRNLIKERESFTDVIKGKEREIRDSTRELEDAKEELSDFKDSVLERKETISELISSVDESLKRFNELQTKK